MTIGAFTSPLATSSLKRRPARWRSPWPSQQMRAGSPWKWTRSAGQPQPAVQGRRSRGRARSGPRSVAGDVGGVAGEGDPAEGALALAEEGADEGRDEAGEGEGVGERRPGRPARAGCCRSRRRPRRRAGSRASPATWRAIASRARSTYRRSGLVRRRMAASSSAISGMM